MNEVFCTQYIDTYSSNTCLKRFPPRALDRQWYYRDIYIYTYKPRGYKFTLQPCGMNITKGIAHVQLKAEQCQIYQEIGGCYKGMFILQNSVLIRSIMSRCILYVFMRGSWHNARGDPEIHRKRLLNCIAFIDCNEKLPYKLLFFVS